MIFEAAQRIADAVLFEGYMLYPYRPSSIKNRKRFNFGTLWPREFAEAQKPEETWSFNADMLIEPGEHCSLDLCVRFLQLLPSNPCSQAADWETGLVRSRTINNIPIDKLACSRSIWLDLSEISPEEASSIDGSLTCPGCIADLQLQAEPLHNGLYRLRAKLSNETPALRGMEPPHRGMPALALTSAHLLVHVRNGAFVSLLDPPAEFSGFAARCENRGVFPVLVGDAGDLSAMLCSPIILYDYPVVAPESAGNFYDSTEMDEMLALRVMTLTDAEKEEMRMADQRSRAILERTESLPEDHLLKLHGTIREMHPAAAQADVSFDTCPESGIQSWSPFDEEPPIETVNVFGIELHKGDRVRIWPQKRADILDMTVEGKVATIEAIEQDIEDHVQFAVVFDDDPGKDMGLLRQAGHRFFFSPEEIEPLAPGAS